MCIVCSHCALCVSKSKCLALTVGGVRTPFLPHHLQLIFFFHLAALLTIIHRIIDVTSRLSFEQRNLKTKGFLPSPAPKCKLIINASVKQQSKGVFAAQGCSNKTVLCPRLNKIVRKEHSLKLKTFLFFIQTSYI